MWSRLFNRGARRGRVTGGGPLIVGPDGRLRMNIRARRRLSERLAVGLEGARRWLGDRWRRRWVRVGVAAAAVLMIGVGSAWAWVAFRPRATPDILHDDLGNVLDFTFVHDGFNDLPLEERLNILEQLFRRLRGMSQSDSAYMAAFAAGLTGRLRRQVEENLRRLMVDLWVDQATRYREVPAAERGRYLDEAFIRMMRLGERVSGFEVRGTDQELLERARRDARRDEQRLRELDAAGRMPGMDRMGERIFTEVQRGSAHAGPAERANMARFMRDMTRHLRGQDLDTGRPLEPGQRPPPSAPPTPPTPPAPPSR
jgi:hypothetical protein